jgi:hypothetical protein
MQAKLIRLYCAQRDEKRVIARREASLPLHDESRDALLSVALDAAHIV